MRSFLFFAGRIFSRIVLPSLAVGMSVSLLIVALGHYVGAAPTEHRSSWLQFTILSVLSVIFAVTYAVLVNLGWKRDRRELEFILEAEREHEHE